MIFALLAFALTSANPRNDGYIFTGTSLAITNVLETSREDLLASAKAANASISDIETVTIDDKTLEIGEKTFFFFTSLKSVSLPQSLKTINKATFYHCNTIETIAIPDSVTYIGLFAFALCLSLKSIIIPPKVTEITKFSFAVCHSLESVTFPQNSLVDTISENCFEFCISLKSIVLPKMLDVVFENAFLSCASLEDVRYCGPKSFYKERYGIFVNSTNISEVKVHVNYRINNFVEKNVSKVLDDESRVSVNITKKNKKKTFQKLSPVSNYTINITELIIENCSIVEGKSIDLACGYSYINRSYISKVTINEGITKINDYAFVMFFDLMDVTLPKSLTWIGKNAFDSCYNLTKLIFPDSLDLIDDYAFYNCANLSEVVFPETLSSIGKYAFSGCESLTVVIFPDGVHRIYDYAFNRCFSLKKVVLYGRNLIFAAIYSSSIFKGESIEEFRYCGSHDISNVIGDVQKNFKVYVRKNYRFANFSGYTAVPVLNGNCEFDEPPITMSPTKSRPFEPTKSHPFEPTKSHPHVPTKPNQTLIYSPSPHITEDASQERISSLEFSIKVYVGVVVALVLIIVVCLFVIVTLIVRKKKTNNVSEHLVL